MFSVGKDYPLRNNCKILYFYAMIFNIFLTYSNLTIINLNYLNLLKKKKKVQTTPVSHICRSEIKIKEKMRPIETCI